MRGRNGATILIRNSLRWKGGGGHQHSKQQQLQLLEPLKAHDPSNERRLKWYACGPTVYDAAHLGHARCVFLVARVTLALRLVSFHHAISYAHRAYVSQDVIRRVLTDYFGYDVLFVMGVTDVDDKIIQRGRLRWVKNMSAD